MLLKATKVLQTEMLFSNIFLSLWWPRGTLTDIINCAKGTRAAPDKQKASVKEMVVDNSTNNSSSNINKISVFGKGNTVFTDPKDRQVKHYYPNKNTVVTLSIESGQKEFLRVRRNQHIFLLSTWNLYLRKVIFVTDIGVLTIETFLIERPV